MKISKNRVIFSKNCLGIDMVRTGSQDQAKRGDNSAIIRY